MNIRRFVLHSPVIQQECMSFARIEVAGEHGGVNTPLGQLSPFW
jgi:hypothetical protein